MSGFKDEQSPPTHSVTIFGWISFGQPCQPSSVRKQYRF
jgi:hypothetical protein